LLLSIACQSSGYVAAYWNIPILVELGNDPSLSNMTRFNTMIRLSASTDAYSYAFAILCQLYGWRRIVLLYEATYDYCQYVSTSLGNILRLRNVTIAESIQIVTSPQESEIAFYIEAIQQRGRSLFSLMF